MHEFCSSQNICVCMDSKEFSTKYHGPDCNSRIQHGASSIRKKTISCIPTFISYWQNCFANRCFQLQLHLTTLKSTCCTVHHMRLCTPSNCDNLLYFPHKFIFLLFLVRYNLQRRRQHPNLCIQRCKDFWITVIILHAKTKDLLVERTMDVQ